MRPAEKIRDRLQFTFAIDAGDGSGGFGKKGDSWLAYLGYAPVGPVSWAFRVSGDKPDDSVGASEYIQYTVCPTYKFTDNLSIRAEFSYYDFKDTNSKTFWGAQALFKF